MRCPVRTAEVKRSLTLIELGQISKPALAEALEHLKIPFTNYDYPDRYNSPQRQIAFPYRGSVILTFRSHNEALETKRRFDSETGIVVRLLLLLLSFLLSLAHVCNTPLPKILCENNIYVRIDRRKTYLCALGT
jgi:hypothetical protein